MKLYYDSKKEIVGELKQYLNHKFDYSCILIDEIEILTINVYDAEKKVLSVVMTFDSEVWDASKVISRNFDDDGNYFDEECELPESETMECFSSILKDIKLEDDNIVIFGEIYNQIQYINKLTNIKSIYLDLN